MAYTYKKTKLNGKRIYSHRKVWVLAHGPIPEGCVVHHINGNSKDNRLQNLALMTKEAHHAFHQKDRKGNPESLLKYYKTHTVWNKGEKYGSTEGYRKALAARRRNYSERCRNVFNEFKRRGVSPRKFAQEQGLCQRNIYNMLERGRTAAMLSVQPRDGVFSPGTELEHREETGIRRQAPIPGV